jgi:hypothetical protein
MLLHAAPDRQQLLVRQPDPLPIKCAHLVELIGKQADIYASFREFHFFARWIKRADRRGARRESA